MEYIGLIAFVLLALLMVAPYTMTYIQEKVKYHQAENSINGIQDGLEKVYALGKCSETIIYVEMPDGVSNYSIQGQVFSIRMGEGDVVGIAKAPVVGYIPVLQRGYNIPLKYTCSEQLVIGDALSVEPKETGASMVLNVSNSFEYPMNVTNNLDQDISNVVMNATGEFTSKIKFNPKIFNLTAKSTQEVMVNVTADSSVYGYHTVYLTAKANEGFAESTLTLVVSQE